LAKCAYHSNREAVGACVNCGKLICEECKTLLAGKTYCNTCANEIYLGQASIKTPETREATGQPVSEQIPRATRGFLEYVDEAVGFSISYPENWQITSGSSDFLVGFGAPEAEAGIQASCIVAHEVVTRKENLQSYFTRIKGNLKKKLKGYTPVSEEEITLDQIPAIKHVYTFFDKNVTFKQMAIYLKQGEVGWVINCSCSPDAYNSYQPTFEAVAASFQLSGINRGDRATLIPSKAAMRGGIRGWGIGLIIMGIIQIAVPVLDTTWGGVLIALGILELFVQHRSLFIINGLVIIIAGVMNLVVAFGGIGGVGVFAVLQFIWGINEIRKVSKYRSAAARTPKV
jgi:hypothetical protein